MTTGQTTINTAILPCNSSPQFSNPPIPYICIGQPFTFNQGAFDPDGDSLVYSLGPCFHDAPTTQVNYDTPGGYSPTTPLGPSWDVSIDPLTGDLTVLPTPGGLEVGVLCVYVQEYRNGVLIGTVVRDMQITALDCGGNIAPMTAGASNITGGSGSGFNVTTCEGNSLCFDLPVVDANAGQTVTFAWDQSIPGATFSETGGGMNDTILGVNPSATFCWTPPSIGTYTFLMSMEDDNCPLLGSNQYTMTINVIPGFSVTSMASVTCLSAQFDAVITGGSAPFSYAWTGAGGLSSTVANPVHTYPADGSYSYTVDVTDANGCTFSASGTLVIQPQVSVSVSSTDVGCAGGADGTATAFPANGTPGYSFLWNSIPPQTTAHATGLSASVYTVEVTDTNGCTANTTVTIQEPPQLFAVTSSTLITCNGGNDGTATAVPSGGLAPYTYLWNTVPPQSTPTATDLTAGIYMVTVTDANGCITTANISVSEPTLLSGSIFTIDATCNGAGDGLASVFPLLGTPPYSFVWSTTPPELSPNATNLHAGYYWVTVSDANGCTTVLGDSVGEPDPMVLAMNAQNVSCFGGADGTAEVSVTSSPGSFSVIWNTVPPQTSAIATGLSAGVYEATVNQGGCLATQTATITEPSVLLASATATNATCAGMPNGSATVTATGGSGPYAYVWNTTPPQFGPTAISLLAGTWTVTVTDDNGCTQISSVVVQEPSPLTASSTSTLISCYGGSDGTATVLPSGGTLPYSYVWNTTPPQVSALGVGLSAGMYTVTITDGNGCQTTETITINEPTPLTLSTAFIPPLWFCWK